MLVRKRTGNKYALKLLKKLFGACLSFPELVVIFQLKTQSPTGSLSSKIPPNTVINIYE
jgi:hypothetical protein